MFSSYLLQCRILPYLLGLASVELCLFFSDSFPINMVLFCFLMVMFLLGILAAIAFIRVFNSSIVFSKLIIVSCDCLKNKSISCRLFFMLIRRIGKFEGSESNNFSISEIELAILE